MNIAQVCSRSGSLLLVSLLLGLSGASAMAESPAPKKPNGYLPVEDVPKREDPAMSPDDRAKLVKDLAAARDRQAPRKPQRRGQAREALRRARPAARTGASDPGSNLRQENRKVPIKIPAANAQRPKVHAEMRRNRLRKSTSRTSCSRSVMQRPPAVAASRGETSQIPSAPHRTGSSS